MKPISIPVFAVLVLICTGRCVVVHANAIINESSYDNDLGDNMTESVQQQQQLPTVSVNGVLYYDMGGANRTEIVLPATNRSVKGLTVIPPTSTSNQSGYEGCKVEILTIENGLVLDPNVTRHCPRLRTLTMRGKKNNN